jgi:hypothetical protein
MLSTTLEKWIEGSLIKPLSSNEYKLSTNGSWFVGNMVEEMGRCFPGLCPPDE